MGGMPPDFIRRSQEPFLFRQHINIPLAGRDDFHIGPAPFMYGYHMGHLFPAYQGSVFFQFLQYGFSGLPDLHSANQRHLPIYGAVRAYYPLIRKTMLFAPGGIRRIPIGGAHNRSRPFIHAGLLIRQNRDFKTIEGNTGLFPRQMPIPLILRVYKNTYTAVQQLRPGGGYQQRFPFRLKCQIIENRFLLFHFQLRLGDGGPALGTP